MNSACYYITLLVLAASTLTASLNNINTNANLEDNTSRIVGGKDAHIAVYNYQVSLRYKSLFEPEQSYEHICSGAIYSDIIVITAAHCVIGTVPSQFKVVAGSNYRSDNSGTIVPVKEIIMNENYKPNTAENDIAILVLGLPLRPNNFTIGTIDLVKSSPITGATATITGWRRTKSSLTEVLQVTRVPIVSHDQCKEDHKGQITDSMFCINAAGNNDCEGDSGGPVVVNDKLAGILSRQLDCTQPNLPGISADVAHLRNWLLEKIAAYQ
ncbi:trypsin zeta-like [Teleopsis dalmanni]|uniref:trypsin zeta-like n=1 Tax=Teleopsis dalmanni TaxID=139649 RepID=UPI0018CD60CE|nr:trypsin zeta-like [Teleopsis dalmanni]